MKTAIVGVLGFLVWAAGPGAQAALINDYSQSDDVWTTPVAPGHTLLDLRGSFAFAPGLAGPATLPGATFALGIAPGTEIGLWGTAAPPAIGYPRGSLNPFVKVQLPWEVGPFGFGVVAGGQVPLAEGIDGNAALEGVMQIGFTPTITADVGVGFGRSFTSGASLGHGNLAGYLALDATRTLLAEVSTTTSSLAPPSYLQHVGIKQALGGGWSGDLGVAVTESPWGITGVVPQLGITFAP